MNKVVEVQVLLTKMRKFFLRIINNAVKNEVLTSMHGLYLVALNDGEKTKGEIVKICQKLFTIFSFSYIILLSALFLL